MKLDGFLETPKYYAYGQDIVWNINKTYIQTIRLFSVVHIVGTFLYLKKNAL